MPSVQSSGASAGSPGAGGVLIVGGGQAAMHLASSLRELGWQAAVTIVSEESRAPYQRPPLSKAFLSGNADPTTLEFRSAEHYERERITVLTGQRVTEPAGGGGRAGRGSAVTEGGGRLEFGHLALATGARPRRLAVPGADLAGVCYLRDVGHALELRERLAAAERVLVVGGGFIGLEAAAAATAKGKAVTVVEAADRLIGRVVAPVISDFYAAAHRRRGVRVLLGTGVSPFAGADGSGHRGAPVGRQLRPGRPGGHRHRGRAPDRAGRAARAGLRGRHRGGRVRADQRSRRSSRRATARSPRIPPRPTARWSGSSPTGTRPTTPRSPRPRWRGCLRRYDAVPWFWSDQGTLKLQIAGLAGGFDQTVLRGDPAAERFSVLYYRGGRLLAVHAVNSPRDYLAVRRALAAGQEIPPELAADAGDAAGAAAARRGRSGRGRGSCPGRGRGCGGAGVSRARSSYSGLILGC